MKKVIFGLALIASFSIQAQYNTNWYIPNISNSTQAGYIGIGTKSTTSTTNTPLPNYNLHVHGVKDYVTSNIFNGLVTGGNGLPIVTTKSSINYGVTSRIGLTNTLTGASDMEGAVLQMSQLNFAIKNQSFGDLSLSVPNIGLTLSNFSKRAWLGNNIASTASTYGKFNVVSSDNGLYIQVNNSLKYGLRVKVPQNKTNALEVYGNSANIRNFSVNGAGQVYARKYTTTLNPIPDYVFSSTYDLMSLTDLRSFIRINHHLPNIPSAKELSSEPVDLGELERLLLEKVEELTLYVLKLEEQINTLKKD
ncbi:hypothetical protein N9F08_00885 [bacterium]|nr:hypothetical protein [bacterium]